MPAPCPMPWSPHRRLVAVQGQDHEDGVRCKRLAQCLGALIGDLVAVQGQYREHGVRFKRLAQCLGTLIGDLVAVQGQDREDGVRFKRLAQCLGALITMENHNGANMFNYRGADRTLEHGGWLEHAHGNAATES